MRRGSASEAERERGGSAMAWGSIERGGAILRAWRETGAAVTAATERRAEAGATVAVDDAEPL